MLGLLVLGNLATGLGACLLLERIDFNYSGIVTSAFPSLADLNRSTQESANIHHAELEILLAINGGEKDRSPQRFAAVVKASRELLARLGWVDFPGVEPVCGRTGMAYLESAQQVCGMNRSGSRRRGAWP